MVQQKNGRKVNSGSAVCACRMTGADCPDPDVIRVGDEYYMISATGHFFPGGSIWRSKDLCGWEHAAYVFGRLDSTPAQTLSGEQSIYKKGMGAPCIRWHGGRFYVCFSAADTGRTYLYMADAVTGPWEKRVLRGCYPGASFLFDDDGRVYLVWTAGDVRLTELTGDLSALKEGGTDRIIVEAKSCGGAGFRNPRIYKKDGRYYLLAVRLPEQGAQEGALMCFFADDVQGGFSGAAAVAEDGAGQKTAGGCIVDAPDGRWYALLTRDEGAAGVAPLFVPVAWKDGCPVCPAAEEFAEMVPPAPSGELFDGEDGEDGAARIHPAWQWNHEPKDELWRRTDDGGLCIWTDKISSNVTHAVNMLTQRVRGEKSVFEVSLDVTNLGGGDYAGICVLQGCYGWVGVTKDIGRYFLVVQSRQAEDFPIQDLTTDYVPGVEDLRIPIQENIIRLKVEVVFSDGEATAGFFYKKGRKWMKAGEHKLPSRRDHSAGCRYGLSVYSTRKTGGEVIFCNAAYRMGTEA